MGFLIVAVIAAFALAIYAAWRRNRPTRPARAVAAPGSEVLPGAEEGVPTFHVVALGPRGSGKTMLLASMFHQAQTFSGRSYFLTAPFDQVVLLNNWFTAVADPSQDWMSGTAVGDTRELMFTVRTRGPAGASHVVMHLGYLEYSGGLVTDLQAPGDTGQADLKRRIDEAGKALSAFGRVHRGRRRRTFRPRRRQGPRARRAAGPRPDRDRTPARGVPAGPAPGAPRVPEPGRRPRRPVAQLSTVQ